MTSSLLAANSSLRSLSRRRFELGGAFYTFNTIAGQAWCYFAIALYESESDTSTGANGKQTAEQAYTLYFGLTGVWLLSFGIFLLSLKKGYVHTFFSTLTGKDYLLDLWNLGNEANNDILRFECVSGLSAGYVLAFKGEISVKKYLFAEFRESRVLILFSSL
jgi:hypothetical protein